MASTWFFISKKYFKFQHQGKHLKFITSISAGLFEISLESKIFSRPILLSTPWVSGLQKLIDDSQSTQFNSFCLLLVRSYSFSFPLLLFLILILFLFIFLSLPLTNPHSFSYCLSIRHERSQSSSPIFAQFKCFLLFNTLSHELSPY